MTPAELLSFLQEFCGDIFRLFGALQANSRYVAGYDANNAYQQVIGRQEVHLQWLSDAIADLGSTTPEPPQTESPPPSKDVSAIVETDVRGYQAVLDKWTKRVESVTNARNRKLLELIVGEMHEHLRLLQQAREGRSDLLGRHADGKVLRGSVMAARPKN